MSQSLLHRERRNALAAWIRDRFGPDDESVPDAAHWKDAADLLKFLRGVGLQIVPLED